MSSSTETVKSVFLTDSEIGQVQTLLKHPELTRDARQHMQKLAEDVVLDLAPMPKRNAAEEAREEVDRYLHTRQGPNAYDTPSEAFEALDKL